VENLKTLSKCYKSHLTVKNKRFLLAIPLILSAFTHLWNPIGYPSVHVDEGHYLRRAMQVMEGVGSQEMASSLNEHRQYDHPYFGPIFLAFMLQLLGYPASVSLAGTILSSVEILYLIPRIIMGLLAILDTWLVYKIAERRYSSNVALIASTLFAVMPMTWLLRRVLLDSILLPFLLTSILLAVNYRSPKKPTGKETYSISLFLSGICMGIAIFTKVPSISAIPLIVYLVAGSNDLKKWKNLGVWFIPVILIPAIWPVYAALYGQFDEWIEGVSWQTSRISRALFNPSESIFDIDPVLVAIGTAGIVYGTYKKDLFFILWLLPYVLLLAILGFSQYIHIVLLFPVFCLAAANLLESLSIKLRKLGSTRMEYKSLGMYAWMTDLSEEDRLQPQNLAWKKRAYNIVLAVIASKPEFFLLLAIGTFGLVNTILLISSDANSSFFVSYAALINHLPNADDEQNKVTVIGPRRWGVFYFWIPKYVFNKNFDFFDYKDINSQEMSSIITIQEGGSNNMPRGLDTHTLLSKVENMARKYNFQIYPYTSMKYNQIPSADIRSNY
jgi:hypothetical protein